MNTPAEPDTAAHADDSPKAASEAIITRRRP
jgi:hypothetical protein